MPFDGGNLPAEVRVIDKALELLGPNGEHWTQGISNDRRGNRCITGAIRSARYQLGVKGDKTIRLLIKVINWPWWPQNMHLIEEYNDAHEFADVISLLLHVRAMAILVC
jgi:hypothetical protein